MKVIKKWGRLTYLLQRIKTTPKNFSLFVCSFVLQSRKNYRTKIDIFLYDDDYKFIVSTNHSFLKNIKTY